MNKFLNPFPKMPDPSKVQGPIYYDRYKCPQTMTPYSYLQQHIHKAQNESLCLKEVGTEKSIWEPEAGT